MLPDVVTFWHGPLDPLRLTCLRSQVAAGHRVTLYSFDPIAGLPDGVGNAEAEAILPHAFSEKIRPPQPDGSWRDWGRFRAVVHRAVYAALTPGE